ncbi:recombinase XerD [Streptomyces griseoflavus]|uniref:tyrosine-type recombinase/integrase n=1 Tax=Streptomyces rimosus TaxID=1927 RepID=UPI0004C9C58F|nr:tyrosine-type recombinase/integrase [Streptomyces rimosus]KOG52059.1 recombinase XerD [Streptomyces griseoflavus]
MIIFEFREGQIVRAFRVRLPDGTAYWTVLDDELNVVRAADEYLRQVRFGENGAESTTKSYAGAIALYLAWCLRTNRRWADAGAFMGLFMTWLKHVPRGLGRLGGAEVLAGPGQKPVRGERRINVVLSAVRGFLMHGVRSGLVATSLVPALYDVSDSRDLPEEARLEGGEMFHRLKARHRMQVPKRPVDRASDEEIVAMLRACRSARDRLILLLMARAGLRRGEVVGLRREDIHFLMDSSPLGCLIPRSHLHVVRRQNVNGAWAKSIHSKPMPVDFLLVRAYDQYVFERATVPAAQDSDFVLVNLFREPVGAPMPPGAINDLVTRLEKRAGLTRHIKPHMCRHAFGSNVADAGGTWEEVSELLRHEDPGSAAVYMHPSEARLREAVERVPSPRGIEEIVR